jgi:hypothetical protein
MFFQSEACVEATHRVWTNLENMASISASSCVLYYQQDARNVLILFQRLHGALIHFSWFENRDDGNILDLFCGESVTRCVKYIKFICQ